MNRINEIGDTPKGQDALGQVHGRAIKRRQMLGDKGAISRKLDNTARDAQHKAYTQGKKHGFDIYDPNGSFDKGVSKGYQKAKTNESTLQKIVKDVVKRVVKESIPPMGLGKPSFDSKHIGVIKAVRNLVNELEKVGAEDWIIQQAYEIEHQFVDSYGDNGISDEMLR